MSKPKLRIEVVSLASLKEDPRNPRSHDQKNLDAIKASLEKFGQVEPLVIQKSTGLVVGGNGRLGAMRAMGWKTVEVTRQDLTDEQARALSVTLNRTAELAGWDTENLSEAFKALDGTEFALDQFGWTVSDVTEHTRILDGTKKPKPVKEPPSVTGTFKVLVGDCLEVMPTLPENSVDSVVTDPPYGLSFMGKNWDHEVPGVAFWKEALRVAKPGAHLIAFGGTRTFHRLVCAIEDAGWEIRDGLMWLYGSGFPKSLDVSKAIDAHLGATREVVGTYKGASNIGKNSTNKYITDVSGHATDVNVTIPATAAAAAVDGYGTALKPAWEPIILARKPLDGTVAENVLKWGTGGININGTRVGTSGGPAGAASGPTNGILGDGLNGARGELVDGLGRWPANVMHDGSAEVTGMIDAQSGSTVSNKGTIFGGGNSDERVTGHDDEGGASRFFYSAKASEEDRDEGLDDFPTLSGGDLTGREEGAPGTLNPRAGAGGSTEGRKNGHPTVKPTSLMRYMCKLVTPPGGTVFDPFAGSCSTGKGALLEGFNALMIERDPTHAKVGEARMAYFKRKG